MFAKLVLKKFPFGISLIMIYLFQGFVTIGVCVLIMESEHVPLPRIGLLTEIEVSRIMTYVFMIP